MPSIFDKLYAAHSAPVRTLYESEEITRYPAGDESSGAAATGIFTEMEPRRDESRGAEVVRQAVLEVPDSLASTADDSWLIRGELWQTVERKAPAGGQRRVMLQRNDIEHAGRAGDALR